MVTYREYEQALGQIAHIEQAKAEIKALVERKAGTGCPLPVNPKDRQHAIECGLELISELFWEAARGATRVISEYEEHDRQEYIRDNSTYRVVDGEAI